jgi:ribosomal protein S18 acetylase RimI-like enzyme
MAYKQAERILYENENFFIKEAKPAEREELFKLFEKHILKGTFEGVDEGKRRPPENLLSLVAMDKKRGVLAGGIERDMANADEHLASTAGLVVKPDFRGKGIGKKLVEIADLEMEKYGIERVTAIVSSEGGWKIYRAQGYYYDEETKAHLRAEGIPEDRFVKTVPMVKEFGGEPALKLPRRMS